MDEGKVSVSPASVYRVLISAGIIRRKNERISKKGSGFNQPLKPHEHWHTDITFIKIKSIFYYLILALDGYSRFIVSWNLLPTMTEADVELVIQKALDSFPTASPRVISDNGSQFTAKEFKSFLNQVNLTHVTTSPYYPQSNGKLERCNKTIKQFLKTTCILDLDDGKNLLNSFIRYYNYERLHSAIGYVTPHDRLAGNDFKIKLARSSGLAQAKLFRSQFWNFQSST
jgi:putative transposase